MRHDPFLEPSDRNAASFRSRRRGTVKVAADGRAALSRVSAFTIALALFVAGCAAQRPAGGPDPRVESFVQRGWLVGDTSAAVQAKLGEPATLVTTPTPNRHRPSQVDESVEIRYPGLALLFYRVKEKPPRELPLQVTFTDDKYEAMYGLHVGSSVRNVEKALGDPSAVISADQRADFDAELLADCDDSPCAYRYAHGQAEAFFVFRNGRVSKIAWVAYVD